MNNRNIIIVLIIIAIIGIGIAGGGEILKVTETKDLTINLTPTKTTEISSGIAIKDLNEMKYKTYCDGNNCTITLDKNGLFNNRTISLKLDQNCLDWNARICLSYYPTYCVEMEQRPKIVCLIEPKPDEVCKEYALPLGCTDFDSKLGVCLKWDKELTCLKYNTPDCNKWSTPNCLNWTKWTKTEFVQMAIEKEIDFVSSVYARRKQASTKIDDMNGVVIVKGN